MPVDIIRTINRVGKCLSIEQLGKDDHLLQYFHLLTTVTITAQCVHLEMLTKKDS